MLPYDDHQKAHLTPKGGNLNGGHCQGEDKYLSFGQSGQVMSPRHSL